VARSRVRVALVGAGGFGGEIAKTIGRRPELELVGVVDVNTEAARARGDMHGVPWWGDHRICLSECECDAVAVATPHNTHRDIVVDAATAGRHIFCEKTMAITVAECHDMIEAAERHGVKLMVGHKRRFRAAHAEIKRLLDSGEFGSPLAINVHGFFGRQIQGFWASREACGGLLYWAGTHDFDTIRHYMGEVDQVSAMAGPKMFPDITDYDDAIAVNLRFRSGVLGSIQVTTFFPMATYRTSFSYEIACERGGIAYDPRQVAVHYAKHHGPTQTTFFEGYGFEDAFATEWDSFAAWVLRGEPPVLTGDDGLRAVEIMQAAYLSIHEGGRPISLPLDRNERRPFG